MVQRHRKKSSLAVILVGLSLVLANQAGWLKPVRKHVEQTQPGLYYVSEFIDGDTIAVDMNGKNEKVRLIGVDTPETHDPRKPVECFGQAAAAFTKQLIGHNNVRLAADPTNTNRDRYNRLLRYVYLPDGTLVNAEIIKQGYGFAYVGFPFQKLDEFRSYETMAREANKGLWGGCQPYFDAKGYIHSNSATN